MKSSFETRPVPGTHSLGFVPTPVIAATGRAAGSTPEPIEVPVVEVDVKVEEAAPRVVDTSSVETRTHLAALQAVLEQAVAAHAEERARLTSGALEIGTALAERILGRELTVDPSALFPLVKRAVETLAGVQALTVEVGLRDLAAIDDGGAEELAALGRDHGLEFRANPTLGAGEARVSAGASRIDIRVDALLQTIRDEAIDEWQEEAG